MDKGKQKPMRGTGKKSVPREIKLNNSEAVFSAMVASTSASLVIFQGNKFIYVNPSYETLTGYSAEELYRMNFWENAHPDHQDLVKERGMTRQKGGKMIPPCWTYKVITRGGEERWVEVRPSYFEYDGKPAAIATVVNATDQKIVEKGLETIIKSRTAELSKANTLLKKEIEKRKQIESVLKKRERELKNKSGSLERMNTALKVLLKNREEDKVEFEEKILSNVKELVMPYISKLKVLRLNKSQMDYVEILESHLGDIVSPFLQNLKSRYFNLTPREIEIASLVKEGKKTKDIAIILGCSRQTVDFHRFNIRDKLGMRYKKANLRSHLLSLK